MNEWCGRLLDIKNTEMDNGIPNCMTGMSVRLEIIIKMLRSSNKQHDRNDHGG